MLSIFGQGEYAIAIGARAARNFAEDNSITLNATGQNLDPTADGLYIKPIREVVENTVSRGQCFYFCPQQFRLPLRP